MINSELIANQACPMTASVNWNPNQDTREISEAWFEAFLKLPLSVKYGLSHLKVQEAVTLLAQSYRIQDPERIGEISRIVREVFLKGLREGEIKQRVISKLRLPVHAADHFMIDLRKVITFVKKVGDLEIQKDTEQLDVISALKRYIKFGDQRVTERFIKLKVFEQPVEPTVKNWLEDYFSRMGTDKHTSIQRTDFLFNSENGKKLSSTDREKLSIILKSYDTNDAILLDKETQEIIYSETFSESQEKTGIALPIEQPVPLAAATMPNPAQKPMVPLASPQPKQKPEPPHKQIIPNGRLMQNVIREKDAQKYKPFVYQPTEKHEVKAENPITIVDPKRPASPLVLKKETPKETAKNVVDLSDYM